MPSGCPLATADPMAALRRLRDRAWQLIGRDRGHVGRMVLATYETCCSCQVHPADTGTIDQCAAEINGACQDDGREAQARAEPSGGVAIRTQLLRRGVFRG